MFHKLIVVVLNTRYQPVAFAKEQGTKDWQQ
jgi:hypothetical protein